MAEILGNFLLLVFFLMFLFIVEIHEDKKEHNIRKIKQKQKRLWEIESKHIAKRFAMEDKKTHIILQ